MKINIVTKRASLQQSGFTLIEMIGVLAVIAILAAVLIPKVFEAINNARVNNAAMTVNSVKTACIDHYAKYGSFPIDGSQSPPADLTASVPIEMFDPYLVKEGLMDKPFAVKIGDGADESATTTRIRLIKAVDNTKAVTGTGDAAYNLEGATASPKNDALGTWLLEAVITGVTVADAAALNKAIDGTTTSLGANGQGQSDGSDFGGRVMYAKPSSAGTVEVHIYLTHR